MERVLYGTWLRKHTPSPKMEFQNVFIDPDKDLFHMIVLLKHRAVLQKEGEVLGNLFVRV